MERVADGWGLGAATTMAPDGTATAMWSGPEFVLGSREALPGKPWKSRQIIPHRTYAGDASQVSTGVDAHGTVTAVWDVTDFRGDRFTFWSAQHPAGGTWSRPVQLGDWVRGEIYDWDLAVSPSGAAVFTWAQGDMGAMRAAYRSAKGMWTAPTTLPATLAASEVAIDDEGLATIALASSQDGRLTLVQRSAAGWQTPIKLDANVGHRAFDIDASKPREAVVVWQDGGRLVTGRLVGGKVMDQRAITETGGTAALVELEAASDGSATIAWRLQQSADRSDVHTISQSPTGRVSKRQVIKADTGGCDTEAWALVLALAGNGRGETVLAHTNEPSGLAVAYRSHDSNIFMPQDRAVPEDKGPGCDESSTVDIAENGSVLVTWQNYNGSADDSLDAEPTELLARRATIAK